VSVREYFRKRRLLDGGLGGAGLGGLKFFTGIWGAAWCSRCIAIWRSLDLCICIICRIPSRSHLNSIVIEQSKIKLADRPFVLKIIAGDELLREAML
jgi:hypothetical protein